MKRKVLLALCLAAATAATAATPRRAGRLKVFILAGQSNMEGKGRVEHLATLADDPANAETFGRLRRNGNWVERDDVYIWYLGRKGKLTVGYGGRGNQIGPEYGFGQVVGDRFDEPVLIIKTAWGGRSLVKDFLPPSAVKRAADGSEPGKAYTDMLNHVKSVLGDIKQVYPGYDGRGFEICGFVWFQGWNDMINDAARKSYKDNLADLIRDVREEWKVPKLPVVIGEMGQGGESPNGKMKQMNDAMAAVAEMPEFKGTVTSVPTGPFLRKEPSFDGGYHYNGNAETFYRIGEAFGKAMEGLVGSGSGGVYLPDIDEKKLSSGLKSVYTAITKNQLGKAHASLARVEEAFGKKPGSEDEVKAAARFREYIAGQVEGRVADIRKLMERGDVYKASLLVNENKSSMRGVEPYEEAVKPIQAEIGKARTQISLGKRFYQLVESLQKRRSSLTMRSLKSFAERQGDSVYGRAAAAAVKVLEDPQAKLDVSKLFE